MSKVSNEEYERLVPEKYRDRINIENVRRIHPDDPDWECGKISEGHSCMEFHNRTGLTTHRCCCGVTWEDG